MQNRKDMACGMIGIVRPCPIKSKRNKTLAPSNRSDGPRPCPIKSKRQVEALPVKSERLLKQRDGEALPHQVEAAG